MKLKRHIYGDVESAVDAINGRLLRHAFFQIVDGSVDQFGEGWKCTDGFARVPARFVDDLGWYLIAEDADQDDRCLPVGPFPSLRVALVALTLQG